MITCPKFLIRIHLKPKISVVLDCYDFSKIWTTYRQPKYHSASSNAAKDIQRHQWQWQRQRTKTKGQRRRQRQRTTCKILDISQGLAPLWASSTIFCRVASGSGRPGGFHKGSSFFEIKMENIFKVVFTWYEDSPQLVDSTVAWNLKIDPLFLFEVKAVSTFCGEIFVGPRRGHLVNLSLWK